MADNNSLDLSKIYNIQAPKPISDTYNGFPNLDNYYQANDNNLVNNAYSEIKNKIRSVNEVLEQNRLNQDNTTGQQQFIEEPSPNSNAQNISMAEQQRQMMATNQDVPTPAQTFRELTLENQQNQGGTISGAQQRTIVANQERPATNRPNGEPSLADRLEQNMGMIPNSINEIEIVDSQSTNNMQSLNELMRTQVGRNATIVFLIGENNLVEKRGTILAVGDDYVLLSEDETGNILVCDFYDIRFVTFNY